MSDTFNDVQLLHDPLIEARRQMWIQPHWRIVRVKRSQAGQDTNGDGPDFTS